MSAIATDQTRTEWLQERKHYLGGTDVAAIVEKNKYKTAFMVYAEKTGQTEDQGVAEAAEVGLFIEPLIRTWFERDTGVQPLPSPAHVRHPKYPFLAGNPDGLLGGEGILEMKTHGIRTASDWGEENTDDVPDAYHIQAIWYLGLTGRQWCQFIAVDTGTWKRRYYRVEADPAYFGALVEISVKWWNAHIIKGIAPEPIGLPREVDALRSIYPVAGKELAIATPQLDAVAEEYCEADDRLKSITQIRDEHKAKLIAAIGPHCGLQTMSGTFTYSNVSDKEETDWQKVAQSIASSTTAGPGLLAQFVPQFTATKPGSRRFCRPRATKGAK